MKPEISVIVPVYNVEKYLEECLDSILKQTFKNFEIILVDDGSTDRSGEICEKYAKKDSRIKLIHKKNGGLSDARNCGVEISQGDYITFVDSDDAITSNFLEYSLKELKENMVDIVVTKMSKEITISQEKDYKKEILDRENGLIELFRGRIYRFSACGKLYNSKVIKKYKFPVGKIHEDQATTYKYFLDAQKVVYIDYIGYIYYHRENSILTKKYNIKRLDAFENWHEIVKNIKKESKKVRREMFLRYIYWIFDNVTYIENSSCSKDEKLKYMKIIKKSLSGNRCNLLWSIKFNLRYLILLLLFVTNVQLFYILKGEK